MMICYTSSTIIQGAAMGVIPIVFSKSFKFEKTIDNLKKTNPKIVSNSVDVLKKSIIILNRNPNKIKKLKKKIKLLFKNHINYSGKEASQRIRNILDKEDN